MLIKQLLFTSPYFIFTLLFIFLAYYVYKTEKSKRAKFFILTMIDLAVNMSSYGLLLLSESYGGIIFFHKLQYTTALLLTIFWFLFAVYYYSDNKFTFNKFRKIIAGVLSIVPVITLFFIWTNYNNILWRELLMVDIGLFRNLDVTVAPYYWFEYVYHYLLILIGTIFILVRIYSLGRKYRKQAIVITLGVGLPMLIQVFGNYLIASDNMFPIKISQFTFAITGVTFTWGIFYRKFLDIAPIARRIVFDNVNDLIFVLNKEHRIMDVNNSARDFFRSSSFNYHTKNISGRSATEIFESHPKLLEILNSGMDGSCEVMFQTAKNPMYYDTSLSGIVDKQDDRIGYVAILRDITDIRLAQERSENLLLNILPKDVAEELKVSGQAKARNFNDVTVLFTDFIDFTRISESLSPSDLVAEINTCFKAFDQIGASYGIEKIKTIGDSYMLAGGLEKNGSLAVKDVVHAAIDMQTFISSRRKDLEKQDKPFFEMRVGIHTGPVVAGVVGIKKFQYDIWGNTVNIASRMESSGSTGKVNISQTTYEHIKENSDFIFEQRGKVEARNVGLIEMYYVSKKAETK